MPSSSPRSNGSTGLNNKRLLQPIGNIPPAEAEARYYVQIEEPAVAARLKRDGLRQTRSGSVVLKRPRNGIGSLRIIWTANAFKQVSCIRYLLTPTRFDEIEEKRFERAEPYSLYVINSNRTPLHLMPKKSR